MLILSLILLLLSTSITSRQDKSILYSRATITILLIGILITQDNLFFLFLNKGLGIFGGLFHSTSTTTVFHIVIFAISTVILLLTSFYTRKVWLREFSSIYKLVFTKLIYYQTVIATSFSGRNYKMANMLGIFFYLFSGRNYKMAIMLGIFFYSVSIYNLGGSLSLSDLHFWIIILYLYSQKHKITIKKLIGLTIIVFITPWVLNIIIFSIPYLLDIFLVICLDFYPLMHRIMVFFFSKAYEVLLKILSKKGFIDILTNICILYVIKLVFLGSLSILDIISNVFFTNCIFR